jgi:ketosteroid isomerase-like protein
MSDNATPQDTDNAADNDTANDTSTAPPIVTRYLAAADAQDPSALAGCFTEDGTVVDEGVTYAGRDEIRGWREKLAGQWTYTSDVTSSDAVGDAAYRVGVHVVGDFPGGVADLTYSFTLRDGLIAALHIG